MKPEVINVLNDDTIAIKDTILNTVGETCEKIILFGSHAYGTPREGSDYDFFVVLKDDSEKPMTDLSYMSDSKLIQEWLKYSQNDLISARHLFDDLYPKQTEIACYLSQQCAEYKRQA
ncbi:MAG: nucleotidyltransferase domain-containing protein [Treponema sp.]|jgi:predicted nucleotidyltransferase|nr:nucleotidyltransferase domain-containing protein [Treponema sp.]